jgi:hypothetical protein
MKKHIQVICLFTLLCGAGQCAFAQPGSQSADDILVPAPPPVPGSGISHDVHEAIALAQNAARDAMARVNGLTFAVGNDPFGRGAIPLVIPKTLPEAKGLSELEEDLSVMARVLENAAGTDDQKRVAMGIVIKKNIWGPAAPPPAVYIEGYGALFFLNVNALLVPPQSENVEPKTKEQTSSEWEEARRELSSPPGRAFEFKFPADGNFEDESATYDAEKIEQMKQRLTEALKNAAYIRQLKTDDNVTIVLMGRGQRPKAIGAKQAGVEGSAPPKPSGSKMILRARVSDVEAFQKEKMSLEDFRKKVTAIVY